jgi:hypothetical protein
VIRVIDNFLSNPNHDPRRHAGRVPWEISERLTIIFRKWQQGDFGVRPHRGFMRNDQNRWVRDPEYPHGRDGRFFGEGPFVNGQRFASRRQLVLEGGHAATQAGIAGTTTDGAYSIVMGLHFPDKKKVYADVDCGTTIYYLSTALKGGSDRDVLESHIKKPGWDAIDTGEDREKTKGAKALLKSHETKKPVRVFRSWKAAKIVPNRPAPTELRYDGLYRVVDYEVINPVLMVHRFKMVRVPGQGPLRALREVQAAQRGIREGKRKREREGLNGRYRRGGRDEGGDNGMDHFDDNDDDEDQGAARRRRRIESEEQWRIINLDP